MNETTDRDIDKDAGDGQEAPANGFEPDEPGGDPACWAGAFATAPSAPAIGVVDLLALALAAAPGAAWSVETADLDVNLVVFLPGEGVAGHVNPEVDVLLVGVRGGGTLEIDGLPHTLLPGRAAVIPAGARRAVRAGTDGIAYLTCHRRRRRLMPAAPGAPRRRQATRPRDMAISSESP